MLGFTTLEPALAYWLCFACTVLCVVYGVVNWNNSGKPMPTEKHVIVKQGQKRAQHMGETGS